jgi:polysaccharide biosynthesis transport protein
VGFADALSHRAESRELAGVTASGIDNLWLLPAGCPPPNPAELLGSNALANVMTRLVEQWDVVVLDSAPVGPAADALLLTNQANGALLVARYGRTRRAALRGALAALSGTGRPVVGVVLNDERPDSLSRFSRFDYYHHGYWSETSPLEPGHHAAALSNGAPTQ